MPRDETTANVKAQEHNIEADLPEEDSIALERLLPVPCVLLSEPLERLVPAHLVYK